MGEILYVYLGGRLVALGHQRQPGGTDLVLHPLGNRSSASDTGEKYDVSRAERSCIDDRTRTRPSRAERGGDRLRALLLVAAGSGLQRTREAPPRAGTLHRECGDEREDLCQDSPSRPGRARVGEVHGMFRYFSISFAHARGVRLMSGPSARLVLPCRPQRPLTFPRSTQPTCLG